MFRGDYLDITYEYRKGILFVRLSSAFNKKSLTKLNNLIDNYECKNIVINLEQLKQIDNKQINYLYQLYEMINLKKGQIITCGINQKIKYIKNINNELEAFELIKV